MKTNTLSKISMQTDKLPVSRFNMSSDLSYTTQFGVVQPTHVKYMHAGTKKVVSDESLFYLANLVVPTFGRIKAKVYHQFVALSELLPISFNSRMSGTPYAAAKVGTNIKTERMPVIDLYMLSCFALFGSKLSIYYGNQTKSVPEASGQSALTNPSADSEVTAFHLKEIDNTDSVLYKAIIQGNDGSFIYKPSGLNGSTHTIFSNSANNESASWSNPSLNAFGAKLPSNTILFDPMALDVNARGGSYPSGGKFLIPLGQQWFDSTAYDGFDSAMKDSFPILGEDMNHYNPQNSDVVIPIYVDYKISTAGATYWTRRRLYLCFMLSDYGKRYKSFIEGCGYKLDFRHRSVGNVSLLPLFATYKAYYDLFSINIFENFENSDLGYVLSAIDAGGFYSKSDNLTEDLKTANSVGATARLLAKFGQLFYTEEVDYISAHIANNAISNAPSTGFIHADVVNPANISVVDSSANVPLSDSNGHAYINNAIHGQIDAEFLKKAYRWVNRNTIAGQRIAELLRAQGLGDYVDSCKSNFIGYDETPLVIDDVVSSSDTYDSVNNAGAQLGQRGAKGIGYNAGKKSFTFEANEIGFWVTLQTIVPASGYCQGSDPVNTGLVSKDSFYTPLYDALGMEETSFDSLLDSPKSLDVDAYRLHSQGFGLIPQMSKFKVARNKVLGSFSLPSEEDNFAPYNLNKVIPFDKVVCHSGDIQTNHYDTWKIFNKCNLANVPTAGEAWRYIGRYLFLENFNRIFSYVGWSEKLISATIGNNWSEFVVRDADNFIIHMIDNDQTYAPMKPIEDSFGTDDDGKTNTAIEKA